MLKRFWNWITGNTPKPVEAKAVAVKKSPEQVAKEATDRAKKLVAEHKKEAAKAEVVVAKPAPVEAPKPAPVKVEAPKVGVKVEAPKVEVKAEQQKETTRNLLLVRNESAVKNECRFVANFCTNV